MTFPAVQERTTGRASRPAVQRFSEESANFATHALGLVLSVVGTAALLTVAETYGNAWQVAGCAVYGLSLISLYAASTLSHAFEQPRLRHFFRTLDQVCIFLLIAGTYTPFGMAFMRDGRWWLLLVAVWAAAIAGMLFKLFVKGLDNVGTGAYVALGWLPTLAAEPAIARIPTVSLYWLLAGGILYTFGTFFLARDARVPYFHAVWHLMVIAASACHYIAVLLFVVPWPVR